MLRVAAALVAIPFLLVLLLAVTMDIHGGKLGFLSIETFELGMLPVVFFTSLAMLAIFVPLLLLASRFVKISLWNSAAIGFLSALLPVLVSTWSVLADSRLRLGFRVEHLAGRYPLLAMGALGGLLFWLLAIFHNRTLPHLTRSSAQSTKSAA